MRLLKIILIAVASLLVVIGLFMLFNGSMESNPTAEQMEKVRIVGGAFLAAGCLTGGLGIAIKAEKGLIGVEGRFDGFDRDQGECVSVV